MMNGAMLAVSAGQKMAPVSWSKPGPRSQGMRLVLPIVTEPS